MSEAWDNDPPYLDDEAYDEFVEKTFGKGDGPPRVRQGPPMGTILVVIILAVLVFAVLRLT